MMLYETHEAEISRGTLPAVLAGVDEPVCLLGGWAVYLAVNSRYKKARGRNYHGSKDIDLGFHFSGDESAESVRRSAFARSAKRLEEAGFYEIGSRFVKHYHRETGRALSEERSKKVPMHDLFSMYVDPIVDRVPDCARDVLGFDPLNEAMLRAVFEDGRYDEIDDFGARIRLPKPDVLLSTKMAALPGRTKDHKRLKDILDIYALIWYSGLDMADLRSGVTGRMRPEQTERALRGIADAEYEAASDAIGIDAAELRNVVKGFIEYDDRASVKDAGGGAGWPVPAALGYDTFVKIPKALHQQGADSKPVSSRKLASLTSINIHNAVRNLSFLASTGAVKKLDAQSYALTSLGAAYAKAHVSGDAESIRNASLEMIRGSHLKSLADMLELSKPDLDQIYAWIKAEGRHPDGSGPGKMHYPVVTGIKTLLRIFADAGLVDAAALGQARTKREGKKAPVYKAPAREPESMGRLYVKGSGTVDINDPDTLAIAEMYMEILRKKIKK